MVDQTSFAPLVLSEQETAPGTFELVLYDGDMEEVEDTFDALNAKGNGHGWEGLAQSVVKAKMPEISDRLDFSSDWNVRRHQ